jgi:ATP-dependent RNA helicase DDX49/DBP8
MSTLFKKKKSSPLVARNHNNHDININSSNPSNASFDDLSEAVEACTNTTPLDSSSTSKRSSLVEEGKKQSSKQKSPSSSTLHDSLNNISTFDDFQLAPPLLQTCKSLGYKQPTPVQKAVIPFLISNTSSHILALAATGSGKTAAFVLPILHHLSFDPYGIYAVILSPTRELAKQIYEQVLALGAGLRVKASLIIGGMDMTLQACELSNKPHVCVATPGRLGALLRGPNPPVLRNIKYVVLDEADRLLNAKSGFEGDVAEVLLHGTTRGRGEHRERRGNCQTLLFSATLTRSLESLQEMAGAGLGRLPLKKFVLNEYRHEKVKKRKKDQDENDGSSEEGSEDGGDDSDSSQVADSDVEDDVTSSLIPNIPPGLRQEYIFMPSHVRDAYLITAVRNLMVNGGRKGGDGVDRSDASGWNDTTGENNNFSDEEQGGKKAKSAIIFVSTCEKTALISGILTELGVSNVALHSLLTQNRRLASLAKFKSQQVRVLVATDVASRGLDIPTVDLVLNCELPRKAVDYIHRVGRTARAGRRGRAVSLVCERDVALVHACEKMSGREMVKCTEITDDMAVKMLGPVTKATKLTKMKLDDIGFDELVKKMKERKIRDKKERQRAERLAKKALKRAKTLK